MWSVFVLSLVEIYGDFSLRFYAQTNKPYWLLHGLIGYVGVVYYLIQSFRKANVMYVNGLWDVMSSIAESLAAYFILGDRLEKPSQYIGLVMAVSGGYLLKNGF